MTVTGPASTWDVGGGTFNIADSDGTLTISNGGTVTNTGPAGANIGNVVGSRYRHCDRN